MEYRGRDPKRIKPMLDKLREAWELYPDMRLGQLIVVCAGQGNIFGIEDEVLLEGIEKYKKDMGVGLAALKNGR